MAYRWDSPFEWLEEKEICWRGHYSKPGQGLSYPADCGIALDDPGDSEGWDVIDVRFSNGMEGSIYCFSIIRDKRLSALAKKVMRRGAG